MKLIIPGFFVLAMVMSCNQHHKESTPSNSLFGEWKFTDHYVSIGGPGEWRKTEEKDAFTIRFKEDGRLSYSANFPFADSAYDNFSFSGDRITVISPQGRTTEWPVHKLEADLLELSMMNCIEGCAYRLKRVK
jgi:hypothetical protein